MTCMTRFLCLFVAVRREAAAKHWQRFPAAVLAKLLVRTSASAAARRAQGLPARNPIGKRGPGP